MRFDQLSDEAKETARERYRIGIADDPPWSDEHWQSETMALEWLRSVSHPDLMGVRLRTYILNNSDPETLKGGCPFSGYVGDEIALDPIRGFIARPDTVTTLADLEHEISETMRIQWDREFEWSMGDEAADEALEINGAEYCECGGIK